jgi:hypothetical protein
MHSRTNRGRIHVIRRLHVKLQTPPRHHHHQHKIKSHGIPSSQSHPQLTCRLGSTCTTRSLVQQSVSAVERPRWFLEKRSNSRSRTHDFFDCGPATQLAVHTRVIIALFCVQVVSAGPHERCGCGDPSRLAPQRLTPSAGGLFRNDGARRVETTDGSWTDGRARVGITLRAGGLSSPCTCGSVE